MKLLFALYFWTCFTIVTIVMFLVACVARLVEKLIPKHTDLLVHRVACIWGQLVFFGFPVWKLHIEGQEYLPKDNNNYVIVANHLSAGDIFTIFCTKAQFRWIAKAEAFKLPLIGPAMRWAGYVPVIRGNKSSHELAMKTSRDWLDKGLSMLFFPEGTRSKNGQLGVFKSGAFRLAEESQKPILPIALSGTYHMLRKFWPQPSKIGIHIFPPMQRNEDESLDQFILRVRAVIDSGLIDKKNQVMT